MHAPAVGALTQAAAGHQSQQLIPTVMPTRASGGVPSRHLASPEHQYNPHQPVLSGMSRHTATGNHSGL